MNITVGVIALVYFVGAVCTIQEVQIYEEDVQKKSEIGYEYYC
jgi:hypothetical protein